jgi:hypothetical protein
MTEVKRVFKVNGNPFFPLGAQSCNSSGYDDKHSETAFKAIQMLHGNTLEIPVYWNQCEPKEGKYDFASVDDLIASARQYGIKLILLWFATWKNGNMDYAPAWVKTNPKRFKRVISQTGNEVWNLSAHCKANQEVDKNAFAALCQHLKTKDSKEQTVIGIQIQNESGILGSDRDYGPDGETVFKNNVPAKLVTAMKKTGKGYVFDMWQKAGGKTAGTWPELFGWEAGEFMTAWGIATYIDNMAAAGKKNYDIPMYINVWLMGQGWWPIPGEAYPSGGAVTKVLDIYKWFTPHVDMISPDAHVADTKNYEAVCAAYTREDNPFFMPETGAAGNAHAWNMFRSIANYNCLGEFFFGVERILAPDGSVRPENQIVVDSVRCTAAVIPLLLKYQGTGKIHAVIQEDLSMSVLMDFEGYSGVVEFGDRRGGYNGKDWKHPSNDVPKAQSYNNRGRGLIIQTGKNEFYLVGANYRLFLRPKSAVENLHPRLAIADFAPKMPGWNMVSIDEGHFDSNGKFVIDQCRNGDEADPAAWVEPDCGVIRVIACE